MEPIVIQNRQYIGVGLLCFAFCLCVSILEWWLVPGSAWYIFIVMGLFMMCVFFMLAGEKYVLSESGVTYKFLKCRMAFSWNQVIQAGVAEISYRTHVGPYMLFTFSDGKPFHKRTMGFIDWMRSNDGTGLWMPCNEQVRAMVAKCYGTLDFDLSDGNANPSRTNLN